MNDKQLIQAGSFIKQRTSMGLQGFPFLLHHKFEDRGLLLATTIFQILEATISEAGASQVAR